ncbi:MAG: VOC family protein, partial [Anaerolineales bacterium]|nr:VOC family protein [Anaerolineales bacterium]
EEAKAFYVDKLGFQLQVEMPLPGSNKFVMVVPAGGGSSLVYSLPLPGIEHKPSSSISFEAKDVKETYKELFAKGVEFAQIPTETPWGGVQAVFVDPFGNRFMLQQGGM